MRIVVPTAPGGSADILARLIGGKLHERLGQPVVIENRAGAGQMIGADVVAKSPGDGHTLLLPTVTYTTSAATAAKLPFDPLNDLAGITMIGEGPFLVVVHPSLPVKTVKELIAFAKARPGTLNYASSGTGGITHLITEVFAASAKIKLVHVPYKSVAPAVIDVVGGHVPMLIVSVPSVLPQVKAGRLRALAVTSSDALEVRARAADGGGVRRPGLRGAAVVGHVRAGQDAPRHRRQAERRDPEDTRRRGRESPSRRGGRRARPADDARSVRRRRQERHREMAQDRRRTSTSRSTDSPPTVIFMVPLFDLPGGPWRLGGSVLLPRFGPRLTVRRTRTID